jgi:hypothetical protein
MKRSTWIPLLGVLIALAVLGFIFFASRPDDVVVEGEGVIEGVGEDGTAEVVVNGDQEATESE